MGIIIKLMVIAFLLFFFEIFVPGGLLAAAGATLILVAGYLVGKDYGLPAGGLTVLFSAILAIWLFFVELRLLQSTSFGKQIRLDSTIEAVSNRPPADESIVGEKGRALTRMNPTGKITVGKRPYEAVSMSGLIEKGTPIEVMQVDRLKITVKRA